MRIAPLILLLGCPIEVPDPVSALPAKVAAPDGLFEPDGSEPEIDPQASLVCAKGDREAFNPVHPSNIIDVAESYYFEDVGGQIARLQTVMFDKYSLAVFVLMLREHGQLVPTDKVLDVGSGTGALGLAALAHGAGSVVATELDPVAAQNTRMNAEALGLQDRVDARLVPFDDQGAFSVIKPGERFDLILADPPQGYDLFVRRSFPEVDEDLEQAKEVYFSQDPGACFLNSLLEDLSDHLTDKGRLILAMKSDRAKKLLPKLASRYDLDFKVLYDARDDATHGNDRKIGSDNGVPDMSKRMVMFELRPKR
jgi:predicted RNA methylase